MSVLYEIRVIDRVTAGFGTVIVKAPDRPDPVFFKPEKPEEAVRKLKKEVSDNG